MRDVLAVNRRVDRQRQAQLAHPAGQLELGLVAVLVGRNAIGVDRIDVLKRELDMVEAAVGQRRNAFAAEQNAGGYEIAVDADTCGLGNDILEVFAQRRLAA